MVTARRIRRDRRRYNALRRLARLIVSQLGRFPGDHAHARLLALMRQKWPHYVELDADALVWGWRTCDGCGRVRQTVRLTSRNVSTSRRS